jgi:hypothetical protein
MYVSYSTIKLSLLCAISQLVVYIGIIGKLTIYKMILTSLIFNLFWSLNYFLCALLFRSSPDVRFFDDYSTNMVYLFAGIYGLIMASDLKSSEKLETIKGK